MSFKRMSECPDEYLAQRDAADLVAGDVPDRCALCRAKVSAFELRRCRECGGPCCERCHLSVDNRVSCFGCLKLDAEDAARLMPLAGRAWPVPAAEDFARLDAQVLAYLAPAAEAEEVETVEAGGEVSDFALADAVETACGECGDPAEAGWGGYCAICGVEWSAGPGKLVNA